MSVETAVIFAVLIFSGIVTSSFVLRRMIMYSILLWKRKEILFSKIFDRPFILILIISVILHLFLFIQQLDILNESYLDGIQRNGWIEILISNPVSASLFLGCAIAIVYCIDNCETYLVQFQSDKINIGILWARSAYEAYFDVLFRDWSMHIEDYLNSGNKLDVRNLILICPLSCNILRGLTERCSNIYEKGSFLEIEHDQGANLNRKLKVPVCRVGDNENAFYLMVQFPSSLGTLWNLKDFMPPHKWLYYRESFLTELKKLLRGCPCTILEYDDTGDVSESFDSFLIQKLNLRH